MLVFESKLDGMQQQYNAIDEAIRTARFIRNSCLKYWQENPGSSSSDLSKYGAVLAHCPDSHWAKKLNSRVRQASAERAGSSIGRFFENCQKQVAGKKGYPKFKKHQTHASVEYKTSGWKLSEERRDLTFTEGFEAGTFKLWGSRDLHFYQLKQIKRIRVVRRADGDSAQFCIDTERLEKREPTGKMIGLDMGLNHFSTDSNAQTVENPRFLRKSERALERAQRRLSRTHKGSKNRIQAWVKLGRKHLRVSRQRQDVAVKTARCVVLSKDLVADEALKVRNLVSKRGLGEQVLSWGLTPVRSTGETPARGWLPKWRNWRGFPHERLAVKNHHLAKSSGDASGSFLCQWVEYFGKVFGARALVVPPDYTRQNCSNCGETVYKTPIARTHKCPYCGDLGDRDENAARNILWRGLATVCPTGSWEENSRNVYGELELCLGEATPSSKSTRRKRKSKA